jgi:hypothetical protein
MLEVLMVIFISTFFARLCAIYPKILLLVECRAGNIKNKVLLIR